MAKNLPNEEYVSGTIKVGWTITEKGLGLDKISGELTKEQKLALYDRIEEAVTAAFPDSVDLYLDGEELAPVRVHLDVTSGFTDLEIDDGPVNGMLDDLRQEAEDEG